ncbi:MAG: CBS domain-containing protein [Candidatus Aenigmarchaeota archaeon]|nr:CBS domain-containing protein [Candidatus Aenigmarchaeota archaeon]
MRRPFFKKRLKVKDVMTTDLAKVSPNTTLQQAAKKMAEYRVGNVLVVEGDKLVGIVTERDITRKAIAKNKSPKTKVKDIMTSPVMYVSPDDELLHISDKMLMNNITRMPVVDLEKKEVVGIVTMKDILRVLPKFLLDRIEWLRIHPGETEFKKKPVKGICEVCGKYTENLRFSKGLWVCENCE